MEFIPRPPPQNWLDPSSIAPTQINESDGLGLVLGGRQRTIHDSAAIQRSARSKAPVAVPVLQPRRPTCAIANFVHRRIDRVNALASNNAVLMDDEPEEGVDGSGGGGVLARLARGLRSKLPFAKAPASAEQPRRLVANVNRPTDTAAGVYGRMPPAMHDRLERSGLFHGYPADSFSDPITRLKMAINTAECRKTALEKFIVATDHPVNKLSLVDICVLLGISPTAPDAVSRLVQYGYTLRCHALKPGRLPLASARQFLGITWKSLREEPWGFGSYTTFLDVDDGGARNLFDEDTLMQLEFHLSTEPKLIHVTCYAGENNPPDAFSMYTMRGISARSRFRISLREWQESFGFTPDIAVKLGMAGDVIVRDPPNADQRYTLSAVCEYMGFDEEEYARFLGIGVLPIPGVLGLTMGSRVALVATIAKVSQTGIPSGKPERALPVAAVWWTLDDASGTIMAAPREDQVRECCAGARVSVLGARLRTFPSLPGAPVGLDLSCADVAVLALPPPPPRPQPQQRQQQAPRTPTLPAHAHPQNRGRYPGPGPVHQTRQGPVPPSHPFARGMALRAAAASVSSRQRQHRSSSRRRRRHHNQRSKRRDSGSDSSSSSSDSDSSLSDSE
jgi:hypothetical protein